MENLGNFLNVVWNGLGDDGWTGISAIGTLLVSVIAIFLSIRANKISKKQYIFSTKPIIECYLAICKTDVGTPCVVLVVENYGSLIARNITLSVEYPVGISNSEFWNYAKLLKKIPFTLAPHTKLSTPICWHKEMSEIVNGEIKISGKFSYYNIDKKVKKENLPQATLTVEEYERYYNGDAVRKCAAFKWCKDVVSYYRCGCTPAMQTINFFLVTQTKISKFPVHVYDHFFLRKAPTRNETQRLVHSL